MAITKDTGRQWPLVGKVTFGFADIVTTATAYEAMDLPPTANVLGGGLRIDEVWNAATSNTLSVGDTGLATRYLTTKDLQATVGTYFPFVIATDGGALDVNVTTAHTGVVATTGIATLFVLYVLDDKANEVQPTADTA